MVLVDPETLCYQLVQLVLAVLAGVLGDGILVGEVALFPAVVHRIVTVQVGVPAGLQAGVVAVQAGVVVVVGVALLQTVVHLVIQLVLAVQAGIVVVVGVRVAVVNPCLAL